MKMSKIVIIHQLCPQQIFFLLKKFVTRDIGLTVQVYRSRGTDQILPNTDTVSVIVIGYCSRNYTISHSIVLKYHDQAQLI